MNDKVRENRLRRMADRQGFRLQKSGARDPRALTFGGYQLVDLQGNEVHGGEGNVGRGFAASLEEIERFLTR